jgi:hypothetical protein
MSQNNIQSIIFERNLFTPTQAKKWIQDHGYKTLFYGKIADITEDYIRYRQQSPKKYKTYRTKQISKGIKLILGY